MTAKYHINPETGDVSICQAKKQCRFAKYSENFPHFSSKEEAQKTYEEFMEQSLDPFTAAMRKQGLHIVAEELKEIQQRNFLKHLKTRYDSSNSSQNITDDFYGLSENSLELQSYNTDYENLSKDLSDAEKKAMHDYTGISYLLINKYLNSEDRENYPFTAPGSKNRALSSIEHIDSYIAKAVPKDRTLFRVIAQDPDETLMSSEDFAESLGFTSGEKVSFKGFASCTIDPAHITHRAGGKHEHTAITFVINTRHGAPVDETLEEDFENGSPQQREREILLPRDVEYKVAKVQRARFCNGSGHEVEPLTVFLDEIA